MYYVYLLVNEKGETYTGFSSDLRRRIQEHQSGSGCTAKKGNWKLCYYEAFFSKEDARKRERALKQSPQSRRWLHDRLRNSMELCSKS